MFCDVTITILTADLVSANDRSSHQNNMGRAYPEEAYRATQNLEMPLLLANAHF